MNTAKVMPQAPKPSYRYFRILGGRYVGCLVREGSRGHVGR